MGFVVRYSKNRLRRSCTALLLAGEAASVQNRDRWWPLHYCLGRINGKTPLRRLVARRFHAKHFALHFQPRRGCARLACGQLNLQFHNRAKRGQSARDDECSTLADIPRPSFQRASPALSSRPLHRHSHANRVANMTPALVDLSIHFVDADCGRRAGYRQSCSHFTRTHKPLGENSGSGKSEQGKECLGN